MDGQGLLGVRLEKNARGKGRGKRTHPQPLHTHGLSKQHLRIYFSVAVFLFNVRNYCFSR
jgi:hypothetical protein